MDFIDSKSANVRDAGIARDRNGDPSAGGVIVQVKLCIRRVIGGDKSAANVDGIHIGDQAAVGGGVLRIGSQLQDLVGGGADIKHESSVTGDGIRHDTSASDDA